MPDTGSPSYEHVVPNLPESEGREGGERGGMKSKGKGEGWKEGVGERERGGEKQERKKEGGGRTSWHLLTSAKVPMANDLSAMEALTFCKNRKNKHKSQH